MEVGCLALSPCTSKASQTFTYQGWHQPPWSNEKGDSYLSTHRLGTEAHSLWINTETVVGPWMGSLPCWWSFGSRIPSLGLCNSPPH